MTPEQLLRIVGLVALAALSVYVLYCFVMFLRDLRAALRGHDALRQRMAKAEAKVINLAQELHKAKLDLEGAERYIQNLNKYCKEVDKWIRSQKSPK